MATTGKWIGSARRAAYAKINLYLDVLSRRTDGFHELLTVMHSISLCDDVQVEWAEASETKITLSVLGARLPHDAKNLAYRAAELFLSTTGQQATLHITLRKRIPVAAGLAGGSSDAAAVLRAMQTLSPVAVEEETLLGMGLMLGSDVPFCLVGGTQICRGRGERMQPLACGAPLFIVVAKGREHVSTARAFANMDTYFHNFDGSVAHGGQPHELYRAMAAGKLHMASAAIYNAFEPVVLPSCPAASALRRQLLNCGAYAACMSGSGPSVFGLFSTQGQARRAAAAIGRYAFLAVSAPAIK